MEAHDDLDKHIAERELREPGFTALVDAALQRRINNRNSCCYYTCDQCNCIFGLYILWDWVYAQASGKEVSVVWKDYLLTYKWPEKTHYVLVSKFPLPGVLCEGCVEQNLGRKLYWWDYKHISGNYPEGTVSPDYFFP